jgi:hypothetical protein
MEYVISQGSARHYASQSWAWGRKHAYIDLNVCLFNQLKRWKLPVNGADKRELMCVAEMLHFAANEIGRSVKEHEASRFNRKSVSA